jgi:hypothetical protein
MILRIELYWLKYVTCLCLPIKKVHKKQNSLQMNKNQNTTPGAKGTGVLNLIIEGEKFKWHKQFISCAELKQLAGLAPEVELFLSLEDPWDDELVVDNKPVDLARPGIEEFYIKRNLKFLIEDSSFEWNRQFINGSKIRKLGKVVDDSEIFLVIDRPWEDEKIGNETIVDLARPGIERFIICKCGEGKLVKIEINGVSYELKRGKYSVSEIKGIGKVPISYELEELINGKLTPLDDQATILIKGCEEFFSHARDGSSS